MFINMSLALGELSQGDQRSNQTGLMSLVVPNQLPQNGFIGDITAPVPVKVGRGDYTLSMWNAILNFLIANKADGTPSNRKPCRKYPRGADDLEKLKRCNDRIAPSGLRTSGRKREKWAFRITAMTQ